MSLFVGNISRGVELKEVERLFNQYGRNRIDKRVRTTACPPH